MAGNCAQTVHTTDTAMDPMDPPIFYRLYGPSGLTPDGPPGGPCHGPVRDNTVQNKHRLPENWPTAGVLVGIVNHLSHYQSTTRRSGIRCVPHCLSTCVNAFPRGDSSGQGLHRHCFSRTNISGNNLNSQRVRRVPQRQRVSSTKKKSLSGTLLE